MKFEKLTADEKGLIIVAVIMLVLMLLPQIVWGADTHWPLPFQQTGDTIWITHWRNFDSVAAAVKVGDAYRDTTISMDNVSHNMVTVKYKPVGETYSIGYVGLYVSSRVPVADSIQFPIRLWFGEVTDSVELYIYSGTDSSLETTYSGVSEVVDSVQLADTIPAVVQLLAYYSGEDDPVPFLIAFNPADSTGTTIYDTLYAPPPVPASEVVTLYYYAGKGVMDSITGAMDIRDDVRLSLELIGAPNLNNGTWGILPFTEPQKPDSNGLCQWHVPATEILTPAGAKYRLSWKAKSGWFSRGGTIKTFIVDTIPDPLNIIDATEVW